MEVTVTALAWRESAHRPAIAFAAEAKVPTAKNVLIGTGKPDYAGYLIVSKRTGSIDTHANLSYTFVGSPSGIQLRNIVAGAVGFEAHSTPRTSIFGEILASSSAALNGEGGDRGGTQTVAPEAAAGEVIGSLGLARYVTRNSRISLGLSSDNNGALQLRPGVALWVR